MSELKFQIDQQEETFSINHLREYLEGRWKLDRQISDHRRGETGRLVGEARFVADGEGLVYREEGQLTLGDHSGPAEQAYRYDFPAVHRAAVHFADGRFFHDLDLSSGSWVCHHDCDPDRYEGEFTVLGADDWRVIWEVKGPRKDLRLDSTYCRTV